MEETYRKFITEIIVKAGDILRDDFVGYRQEPIVDESGIHLAIDHKIEKFIKVQIENTFPEHVWLGEEEGENDKDSDWKWIIDPIDGTSNYFCYNPFFCISIALVHKTEIVLGAIHAPIMNIFWLAEKNIGVHVNDDLIKMAGEHDLDRIVIGGRSHAARCKNIKYWQNNKSDRYMKIEMGSAALELAYVATGRLGAYVTEGIKDWDVAAGVLMVKENGGVVKNWQGEDWQFGDDKMIAGRADLVDDLLKQNINQ